MSAQIPKFDGYVLGLNYLKKQFKGSVWLCKVVELSMQYCQKLLAASFEPY